MIARFRADLERFGFADTRLAIAVSGGPDSLALLLLAREACGADAIEAATVDHGLRPESAAEAAFVAEICKQLGVAHTTLTVEVPKGNVQSNARDARYLALGQWHDEVRAGVLVTAHHGDDQAETLLMRLNRGSGVPGLAGIRSTAEIPGWGGTLFRPLLRWSKRELESVVSASRIEPVRDPSNVDVKFDRARVRRFLAEQEWIDPDALAASAEHLEDAWRAIEWFAAEDWETHVVPDSDDQGRGFLYYANVPRAVAIETIRSIIEELGRETSRSDAARAFDRLWKGENASLAGVLAIPGTEQIADTGVTLRVWRFSEEPPRKT
ncbi:tRNA lysidine(34) synthetase TilS [Erythrobacter sp. F6033]|uniref:tRNA lysidine(34) synthetase TilS n=1 Tax=Erythrobacter sp. F6033 TaxID=2926401 RepID=UPI001FF225F5|nr:tRNA lysidine(34) synthetase TilS [Erythrobacter sp. F6033]MCK0129193.1 tRNA lysidine(34) synthetase TilS [Erythrobacter sp. F6033]